MENIWKLGRLKPVLLGFGIFMVLASCSEPASVEEQYTGNWRGPTGDVVGDLMRNNIAGCGEFYQQENQHHDDVYMVACTNGRGDWTLYQVWPRIDRVQRVSLSELYRIGGAPNVEG